MEILLNNDENNCMKTMLVETRPSRVRTWKHEPKNYQLFRSVNIFSSFIGNGTKFKNRYFRSWRPPVGN